MRSSGVYAIQNLVTGRTYIGSSRCVAKRWTVHRADLRRGDHHAHDLQTDWQLYGESAFAFVVLERINDPALLLLSEQLHFDRLDHPYNTIGSVDAREFCRQLGLRNRGKVRSAATRAKITKGHKGKKLSAAHRAKISAGLRGGKRSDETRRKQSEATKRIPHTWGAAISAAKKGKPVPAMVAAIKGKPLNADHRAKIAAAMKGRVMTAEHRAKIGAAHRGMKRSDETRRKLSEAATRQRQKHLAELAII